MSDITIPTHKIITPHQKHEVEIQDYATGYDDEAIDTVYSSGKSTVTKDAEGKETVVFDGATVTEADHVAIERLVKSVDGKTDKILERVLSMHAGDTKFVRLDLRVVLNPSIASESKKKKQSKTTPGS